MITLVGFVLSWFVKQVPLRGAASVPPPSAEEAAESVESFIV